MARRPIFFWSCDGFVTKSKVHATLLLVALCAPVLAQDHAPLPAQCRADYDLWYGDKKEALDHLSFKELNERQGELWKCANVDIRDNIGSHGYNLREYLSLSMMYGLKLSQRFQSYMNRHGEMQKFLNEDAAGKR
jgi:hypothetical protein